MAAIIDHPALITQMQRARQLELARTAERNRLVTEAGFVRSGRGSASALAGALGALSARLRRASPYRPEPRLTHEARI